MILTSLSKYAMRRSYSILGTSRGSCATDGASDDFGGALVRSQTTEPTRIKMQALRTDQSSGIRSAVKDSARITRVVRERSRRLANLRGGHLRHCHSGEVKHGGRSSLDTDRYPWHVGISF